MNVTRNCICGCKEQFECEIDSIKKCINGHQQRLKRQKASEDAKHNMRIAKLGKKQSKEHKRNISIAHRGRIKTPEHVHNISKALRESKKFKASRQSKEYREKRRIIAIGLRFSRPNPCTNTKPERG